MSINIVITGLIRSLPAFLPLLPVVCMYIIFTI